MTNAKEDVLVVNEFHPETVGLLDEKFNTHHLWKLAETEQQALIASLQGKCRAAATASWYCNPAVYGLESLELLSAFGVGVDGIDFAATARLNCKVTNTPDVLNDAVADLAMGLILATTRDLTGADKFVRNRQWLQGPYPFGMSLTGKTLGIIGLGRIGEAIAQRAIPFQMNIAYHNRNAKDSPHTYYGSIAELAANSDILLCMLPGGDATTDLINAEIFEKLGPTGIFINVGRGNSVNETDLAQALRSGTIHSAALDVYKNEPKVPDEFLELDNLVLMPHIGSATVETRRAMGELVVQNLEAFFTGSPLITEYKSDAN